MPRILFGSFVILCVTVVAAPAFATNAANVNGVRINARVLNSFPGATLAITNNYPTSVEFDESGYDTSGGGLEFLNRHDAILSTDGGATEAVFSIDDPISYSADVTLIPGSDAPRKEAGLRLNSGISDDVKFLVMSDTGEIVAFGGGAPLFNFTSGPTRYFSGDTITLGIDYNPSGGGANGVPGQIRYWIDLDADGVGIVTSGWLDWSNLEGGPVDFTAGFYVQGSPLDDNDTVYAAFENISVQVPEPASVVLAGLAVLGGLLIARRRS